MENKIFSFNRNDQSQYLCVFMRTQIHIFVHGEILHQINTRIKYLFSLYIRKQIVPNHTVHMRSTSCTRIFHRKHTQYCMRHKYHIKCVHGEMLHQHQKQYIYIYTVLALALALALALTLALTLTLTRTHNRTHTSTCTRTCTHTCTQALVHTLAH